MTASSTIESKLRKRPPSTVPSDVGGRLLGVKPRGPHEKEKFSSLVHWQYGTSLGLMRAALAWIRDPWAGAAFFAVVWAGELALVPRLSKQTPPLTDWEFKELAIDGWHHFVYAAFTSLAFSVLLRTKTEK
jgi:hypothetical protein